MAMGRAGDRQGDLKVTWGRCRARRGVCFYDRLQEVMIAGGLKATIVCLATPEPFYAVGPHYRDFTQTEDDEVMRLLGEARQWSAAGAAISEAAR